MATTSPASAERSQPRDDNARSTTLRLRCFLVGRCRQAVGAGCHQNHQPPHVSARFPTLRPIADVPKSSQPYQRTVIHPERIVILRTRSGAEESTKDDAAGVRCLALVPVKRRYAEKRRSPIRQPLSASRFGIQPAPRPNARYVLRTKSLADSFSP